MKKTSASWPLLAIAVATLASCSTQVRLVGQLNMISNRNVESKANYALLRSYMGASEREIRKTRAATIGDAIDQTVRATPGGDFLKNVKVYLVDGKHFAVEGDVWGLPENANFRGFTAGSRVSWKSKKRLLLG